MSVNLENKKKSNDKAMVSLTRDLSGSHVMHVLTIKSGLITIAIIEDIIADFMARKYTACSAPSPNLPNADIHPYHADLEEVLLLLRQAIYDDGRSTPFPTYK